MSRPVPASIVALWRAVPHHGPIIPTSFVRPTDVANPTGWAMSVRYTGDAVSNELAFFTGLLSAGDFVRWCRQILDLLAVAAGYGAVSARPGMRAASAWMVVAALFAAMLLYKAVNLQQFCQKKTKRGIQPQFLPFQRKNARPCYQTVFLRYKSTLISTGLKLNTCFKTNLK